MTTPDGDGEERIDLSVDEAGAGLRLDVFLAEHIEDASRSLLQRCIKDGRVQLDGQLCKRPSRTLRGGEAIVITLPTPPPALPEPEPIPLDILYQDAELVVVNKPAGLIVHPAPGHYTGTLVHAILHHCPDFGRPGADPSRPGIVHRLDKNTSGVMVIAKTPRAFLHLARQAHDHAFDRRYIALVRGEFPEETGRIDASIGRSTADRKRMAITGVNAREAITHFTVIERFGIASLVALQLETGRTHQIRVHLRFAGRPVLGDPTYGVTDFSTWPVPSPVRAALEALEGQALHAELLGIEHPVTGERLRFTAPPPRDFTGALETLRALKEPP